MITEDYVSFEIAKLLKDKGFDEEIETLIRSDGKIYYLDENSTSKKHHEKIKNTIINPYSNDCSCPTLQMAMRWMREIHLLHISADIVNGGSWVYYIYDISCPFDGGIILKVEGKGFKSYEDAIDAALLFALLNLF